MDIATRWLAAADLIQAHRDVLAARPDDDGAPRALVDRQWSSFLLQLDDAELEALEIGGRQARWPTTTPSSLIELLAAVRTTCALPALLADEDKEQPRSRRHERPRKQKQIDAFARLIVPLAHAAARVVDVGSGHGHLTRELAERVQIPVVGLERSPTLAGRARTLGLGDSNLSFRVTDFLNEGVVHVDGDCIVGLHACGELGDALVSSAAASSRVAAVALVGCCLQKQRALVRRPLCLLVKGQAVDVEALTLPKGLLGLSNLSMRDQGVEASRVDNLQARGRRLALHHLLAGSLPSQPLPFGAELEGLNRRSAHQNVDTLVAKAFAVRGLPLPSKAAIAEAVAWAQEHHARARRLQLPRTLLGRVLEVFVLLDRAQHLQEQGFVVDVGLVFSDGVSARNLALVATRHCRAR